MKTPYNILIVGGGTAGIMTAAQIRRQDKTLGVAIIEPAEYHYYQAAWTLVGAGAYDFESTRRPEASVIPKGVDWIKDAVNSFQPDANTLKTKKGETIAYDYLIVAPGVQINLDEIEGLREAMETPNVCSNYIDPQKTWHIIKNFKGGNALFTQPTTPIKCGGAPQKIVYLAGDYFRKHGLLDKTHMIYATPGGTIFGVKEYVPALMDAVKRYNIQLKFYYTLVKIDAQTQSITCKVNLPAGETLQPDKALREQAKDDNLVEIPYDMLHLAPPQSAPDFIKNSPLAVAEGPSKGWLDVDIHSLQHTRYKNIFGLGDVAALPTAKTGAAIRKQAPVVVKNLFAELDGKEKEGWYSGYSSCPLVTSYKSMVLAEFKYDNVRDSDPFLSKFVDTRKEQYSMWLLKKYGLPYLYWNHMLKGRM